MDNFTRDSIIGWILVIVALSLLCYYDDPPKEEVKIETRYKIFPTQAELDSLETI